MHALGSSPIHGGGGPPKVVEGASGTRAERPSRSVRLQLMPSTAFAHLTSKGSALSRRAIPHHICATPNPSLTLTLHQEDSESCAVSARLPFTKIGPEKAGQQRTLARSGCQGARRRVMGARGRHCRREILGTRFHGTNGTYRT